MDQTVVSPETLTEVSLDLYVWLEAFLINLLRPWNAYQLGIALTVFVAAHLISAIVKPRMHDWMRGWSAGPSGEYDRWSCFIVDCAWCCSLSSSGQS